MVSVLARFDGEKIEIPDELRGAAPGNVLIVYPAVVQTAVSPSANSFRDFYGKGGTNRTIEDINAQIRQERDSWMSRDLPECKCYHPISGRAAAIREPVERRLASESMIVTSQLSRLECRCHPIREKNVELIVVYDGFFGSTIRD